ncbi:hypothetical protein OSB04_021430 [Centaurea solstitialis]|uniref:Uncharacterized protein n=1 Tax=Centaurea solstitialis TaxID=347529 RepID=A0AA38W4X2_9ASTR|nr:hypothetical protein OSB04_021430 [Centaurea solstitialis]
MADVDVEAGLGGSQRRKKTNVEILLDCKEKGETLSKKPSPSIYMIRSSDHNLKPKFFKPQVVSIGPLHREDQTLKEFEDQKTTHLHHLLECLKDDDAGMILDKCLQKVTNSIKEIKECYGGMKTNIDDDELAKMMVMDACFILDFLFLSEEHRRSTSRNAILTHSIFRDLVLLENQIPFFVLQHIFDCTISKIQADSLTSSLFKKLECIIPFKGITDNHIIGTTLPHHILGLLQKSFYPPHPIKSTCPPLPYPNHSAVELHEAGVKFKPMHKDENRWPLAIDFSSSPFECFKGCCRSPILRMPTMDINDNTELFLRNVIAYEQCTPDVPDYITSYVCAIDMLVDTKEDLSKLVKSKVLTNHLGSNKDATKMLNEISKQFVFEEFYYANEWHQLHEYYNGYVPRNIALLKRTYFSSPWNIIALLAAIILFTLAIIQTVLRIIK